MIVVDTNIISYFLIPNDRYTKPADALYQKDSNWISPVLWRYELLSVLSVYFRNNILSAPECRAIYRKALELIEARPVLGFDNVFELVRSGFLSSYDCEFVALAKETGLPLITEDKKMIREFPQVCYSMDAFTNFK